MRHKRSRSRSRRRSPSRERPRRSRSPEQSRERPHRHNRSRSRSRERRRARVGQQRRRSWSPDERWRRGRDDARHSSRAERPRLGRYHDALSSGLDEAADHRPYREERRREWRGGPTDVLTVQGLPPDADEAEVQELFAAVPGVASLRLDREEGGGEGAACAGSATLEMAGAEVAQALLDSEWRDDAHYREHRLRLAPAAPSPALAAPPAHPDLDWRCAACRALNFARRAECQCGAPRGRDSVAVHPDDPTHVLRISNLEEGTGQAALEEAIKPHAPLKALRLVRDRATGAPRGVAFAHFYSAAEAGAAMAALDGQRVAGQRWRLRISYAQDRYENCEGEGEAPPGAAALERAGWQPKAFDEDEAGVDVDLGVDPLEAAAAAAAAKEEERAAAAQGAPEGFTPDAASGYLLDAGSGLLYDAATGFYFHPQLQRWGSYDRAAGAFTPYGDGDGDGAQPAAAAAGVTTAAQDTSEMPNAELYASRAAQLAQQAELALQAAPRVSVVRRQGAVIGAAPQLDARGLIAAAMAAEERAAALREQQRAEEARSAAAAAKAAADAAAATPVQGIIHRGKWASRRRGAAAAPPP